MQYEKDTWRVLTFKPKRGEGKARKLQNQWYLRLVSPEN